MTKDALGFWDYVKAAFNLRVHFKTMGHLPLNKLLLGGFAILALGHPGFLFLGLAYEAAYLFFLSGHPRFQNLVQGMKLEEQKEQMQSRQQQLLQQLPEEARRRYHGLESVCAKILSNSGLPAASSGFHSMQSQELSRLLGIFLNLLSAQKVSAEVMGQISETGLRSEIARIGERLARETEGSAVYRSLQGTLEIQKRRLDNLLRVKESQKVNEAELDRIEKQVTLISEETTLADDPERLSQRLDGVIRSLDEAQKWISSNNELFASIEGEPPPGPLPDKGRLGQKE